MFFHNFNTKYKKINFYTKFNSVFNSVLVLLKLFPNYLLILFTFVLICLTISTFYIIIIFWLTSLSSDPRLSSSHSILRSNSLSTKESKLKVLMDFQNSIEYMIEDNRWPPTPTNSSCNHFNCFDVYRCGNNENQINSNEELISVYIYPSVNYIDSNNNPILNPISKQFRQLLEAIISSPYYTADPSKACIFIPNIDLLNQMNVKLEDTSRVLSSLPYWGQKGTNHLIFNMISGGYPEFNTRIDVNVGNALIAGAGFDSWTYRQTFDISIPFFSVFSDENENFEQKFDLNENRKYLVICIQYDLVTQTDQHSLRQLESQHSDLILVLQNDCNQNEVQNQTKVCDIRQNNQYIYPKVLTESTFCLILETLFLGQPVLSDCLMSGSIPVIISDNYVLPFEDKLNWNSFSIRIWSHSLPELISILKSIPRKQIIEMSEQSFFIWKKYFSSMKAIALTTLQIINERIFPNSNRPTNHWNRRTSPSLSKEYAIISPKLSSRQSIGFTAVILTYDRLESLYEVIRSVVKARSCVKVLVVWNNQHKSPPQLNKWPDIRVPLQVIITSENKLSNRFFPYESIETDAILAIDDDIVMLTPDELEFGFQVWKEFPDRIVGFPSRVHRWDNATNKWKYESEWTNDVSMVLTGAAFYHKVLSYH